MAFDWMRVQDIRAEQAEARKRYDESIVPNENTCNTVNQSTGARITNSPHLDRYEALIMKMRTQLIDYIVAHGLVDGFIFDGVLEPIVNGKIVLTADMIDRIVYKLGYFNETRAENYLSEYLPEHFYVSDEHYVHTDNNFADEDVLKLSGIESYAEVNKVIDVLFNGSTIVDPDTRKAVLNITKENIKEWYESNPDTNAFTDAEKAKLATVKNDAEPNKVNDVILAGESVVDKNKNANLTAAKIKNVYESNANTNAYTDAAKALVEETLPLVNTAVADHEKRIGVLEKDSATTKLELADTKDSISELGDEVNSIGGRVTNLESSQTVQDEEIANLKKGLTAAGKVDDVQVDGTSVLDKTTKVANITGMASKAYVDEQTANLRPFYTATKVSDEENDKIYSTFNNVYLLSISRKDGKNVELTDILSINYFVTDTYAAAGDLTMQITPLAYAYDTGAVYNKKKAQQQVTISMVDSAPVTSVDATVNAMVMSAVDMTISFEKTSLPPS